MDCNHAYFKSGVIYVLCDCDGMPQSNRLDEITKHMCGYQRFCPNIRACALLPEWRSCSKLRRVAKQNADVIPAVTQKASRKKKS